MIAQRTLSILLTSLLLAFVATALTGCCCGDMSGLQELAEEEAKRQAEEASNKESGDDDDDEAKGDDGDEAKNTGDDDDEGDSGGGGKIKISELTKEKLEKRIEGLKGWKITNQSNSSGGGGQLYTFTIQKGLKFATVTYQEVPNKIAAKASERAMKKIDNTAVARDGKHILSVIGVSKDKKLAKELLDKILGR